MSQEKVSKVIIKCDRCKEKGENEKPGPFLNGGLEGSFKSWGRSPQGETGGGSHKIDLCGNCLTAFHKFMEMKEDG